MFNLFNKDKERNILIFLVCSKDIIALKEYINSKKNKDQARSNIIEAKNYLSTLPILFIKLFYKFGGRLMNINEYYFKQFTDLAFMKQTVDGKDAGTLWLSYDVHHWSMDDFSIFHGFSSGRNRKVLHVLHNQDRKRNPCSELNLSKDYLKMIMHFSEHCRLNHKGLIDCSTSIAQNKILDMG